MNQSQKRQKKAGIRQEQKLARLAKRPQPPKPISLHDLIASTKKGIALNEGYVAKDAKEIATLRFILRLASLLYVSHVISSVYFWKKGDDILMIVLTSCLMIFFTAMYFSYKKGVRHWVVDLEDKRKYLKELELRLSTSK